MRLRLASRCAPCGPCVRLRSRPMAARTAAVTARVIWSDCSANELRRNFLLCTSSQLSLLEWRLECRRACFGLRLRVRLGGRGERAGREGERPLLCFGSLRLVFLTHAAGMLVAP